MWRACSAVVIALAFSDALAQAGDDLPQPTEKARQPHIEVELIAEPENRSGDRPPRVGVLFKPDPDWHIYWRNPGDTGLAPVIRWGDHLQVSELYWPFPESIPIAHLINLGYHHDTLLWSEYSSTQQGRVLEADVSWLVCKESCIPGSAKLKLDTATLPEARIKETKAMFDRWENTQPQSLAVMDASALIDQDKLKLEIYAARPLFKEDTTVEVFIENLDLVVYGDAKRQRALNNVLIWEQQLSEFKATDPDFVNVVIVVDKKAAFSLAVPVRKV